MGSINATSAARMPLGPQFTVFLNRFVNLTSRILAFYDSDFISKTGWILCFLHGTKCGDDILMLAPSCTSRQKRLFADEQELHW
jgi:hypothetical protein